jgi:hypothetical protein
MVYHGEALSLILSIETIYQKSSWEDNPSWIDIFSSPHLLARRFTKTLCICYAPSKFIAILMQEQKVLNEDYWNYKENKSNPEPIHLFPKHDN